MPFKVKDHEGKGRHYVTTRKVKEGELILHDKPLIMGPATATKPVCLGCMKLIDPTNCVRCNCCRFPMCGKEQCADSTVHEKECGYLKNFDAATFDFDTNNLVYPAIFILRMLLLNGIDACESISDLVAEHWPYD